MTRASNKRVRSSLPPATIPALPLSPARTPYPFLSHTCCPGDKECCTGDIIDTGIICGNGNVAPCIIDSSVTTTSSPEVSPSQAPTSSPSTAKPVSGSEAPAAAPQPPTAPTASVGPSAAPQLPVAQVPTGAPAAVAAPTVAPVVAPTVVVKVTNAPSKPTVAPAAAESPSVATGVTSAPFGEWCCVSIFTIFVFVVFFCVFSFSLVL